MKIIDMHSHIFPPGVAEKVIHALETYYGSRWNGTGELDDLLRNLRRAKITRSVIFSSATKPSQVVPINNFLSRLQQQYPELLIAFGTLHPDFPDCAGEIRRIRALPILFESSDFTQPLTVIGGTSATASEMSGTGIYLIYYDKSNNTLQLLNYTTA